MLSCPFRSPRRMWRLLVHLLCITEMLFYAATSSEVSEDTLKKMSAAGRQYVVEEIKRALLEVTHVKEVMQKTEEKHKHLMDALTRSCEKKTGVMQLVQETEQKLREAEQQCGDVSRSVLASCQPCLEETCKAFYASACRRGFTVFSAQLEELSRKSASPDHGLGLGLGGADPPEDPSQAAGAELDASFNRLLTRFGLLSDQGASLLGNMQRTLGDSLLTEIQAGEDRSGPDPWTGDLDHAPGSGFSFGGKLPEEFSSWAVEPDDYHTSKDSSTFGPSRNKNLCRRLRRRASECWQLQSLCETCEGDLIEACPSVRPLQSEMEEMNMLMKAARQQHAHRLLLVRRHAEDTRRWLSNVDGQVEWVRRLLGGGGGGGGSGDVFRAIAVTSEQRMSDGVGPVRSVTVTFLDSAPITVWVPAELQPEDPAFTRLVVQEALTHFKQKTSIDPGIYTPSPVN